jgi:hypothetical protein
LDLFVVWGDAVDLVMVMMMRQADKACERRGGYSGEERNGGVGGDRSAIEPSYYAGIYYVACTCFREAVASNTEIVVPTASSFTA